MRLCNFVKKYIWLAIFLTGNANLNTAMGRKRVKEMENILSNNTKQKHYHGLVDGDTITEFNVSETMKNTTLRSKIIQQSNETVNSNSNHSESSIQDGNANLTTSQNFNTSENAYISTFKENNLTSESSFIPTVQSISPSMPTGAPQKDFMRLPSSISMNQTAFMEQAMANLKVFTSSPQAAPSPSSITFQPTLSLFSQMMAAQVSSSPHSMYTSHPTLIQSQLSYSPSTNDVTNQTLTHKNSTLSNTQFPSSEPSSILTTNIITTNPSSAWLKTIAPNESPIYESKYTIDANSSNSEIFFVNQSNISHTNESMIHNKTDFNTTSENGVNSILSEIPTISPSESLQPSIFEDVRNKGIGNSPSNSSIIVDISNFNQTFPSEHGNHRSRLHQKTNISTNNIKGELIYNNETSFPVTMQTTSSIYPSAQYNSYFPTVMPSISNELSNISKSPSAAVPNMITVAPTTRETSFNQSINDTSMSSTIHETRIADDSFTISRTMTTTYEGTKMTYGVMFDIQTLDDVKITGLDIHTNSTNEVTYEIYTKRGTHQQFEEIPQSWTPIASGRTEGQGVSHVTTIPSNKLESFIIPSNTTQSFYVTLTTPDLQYSEGSMTGSTYLMSSDMIVMEGIIIDGYPFDINIANPCIWNGAIHYQAKNNVTNNDISNNPRINYSSNTPSTSPDITGSPSLISTIKTEVQDEPSIFFSGLFFKYPSSSNFYPDIKNTIDMFILNTLNSAQVQKNLDMESFFNNIEVLNVNSIPVDIDDNDARCPSSEDDKNLKCGAINIYVEVLHSEQVTINDISTSLTPFIKFVAKEIEYDASYIEPVVETVEVMITLQYVNRHVFGGVEISLFENILLDFLSKPFSIGLLPYKVKDVQVYGDGLAPITLKPEEESLFSHDETWYKFRLDTLITTTYYILHDKMDLGNLVIKSLTVNNEAFIERLQESFQFESVQKIQAHFMVGTSEKGNVMKKTLGTMGILVLLMIALFVKFNPMKNKLKKNSMYRKAESFTEEDSVKVIEEDDKNEDDEYDTRSLNSRDKSKSWVSLKRRESKKEIDTVEDDDSISESYISTGTYDDNVTWKEGVHLPDVS